MNIKLFVLLIATTLVLSACGRNMYDQPKYEAFEPSSLLPGGASAQLPVDNTVARTYAAGDNRYEDPSFYTGLGPTGFVSELPVPLTEELLVRGQERYNIYCSACHNYSGDGQGMVVQKGFPQPTSFHDARLRGSDTGYFVHAIANGFGRMYSYGSRIPPEDRWAIAAYIKALQYSQYGLAEDAELYAASTVVEEMHDSHDTDDAGHEGTEHEGTGHEGTGHDSDSSHEEGTGESH